MTDRKLPDDLPTVGGSYVRDGDRWVKESELAPRRRNTRAQAEPEQVPTPEPEE